jgi:hypothetical protein
MKSQVKMEFQRINFKTCSNIYVPYAITLTTRLQTQNDETNRTR